MPETPIPNFVIFRAQPSPAGPTPLLTTVTHKSEGPFQAYVMFSTQAAADEFIQRKDPNLLVKSFGPKELRKWFNATRLATFVIVDPTEQNFDWAFFVSDADRAIREEAEKSDESQKMPGVQRVAVMYSEQ